MIEVTIEVPTQSSPVKYETDKKTGNLVVDRFLSTPMFYPANYGYMPRTLASDRDPLDVLVITPYPLISGCTIMARPVGILLMEDEGGWDHKIIAVPTQELCSDYNHIKDIEDVSETLKDQIVYFFNHYKDLDDTKWVNIEGWDNLDRAEHEISEARWHYG